MIQILIAVNDFIKSTGTKVDMITKVGTYTNVVGIKLSNDNQVVVISYVVFDKTYSISCRVKDIDYVGIHANIKI